MAGRSVTVELPEDLYARLARRAADAQRSLGDEVVHLLVAAVPDDERLPADLEQELARVEGLDDASFGWR
jgi:plasmid stability protein